MKRIIYAVIILLILSGSCDLTPTARPGTTPSVSFPSMQKKNDLPQSPLVTRPSAQLADNRIGTVSEAQHIDARVWNAGTKWMRLAPDPDGRWQHVNWDVEFYRIDPAEDQIVDTLISNGVEVMIVLDVWHTENRIVYYKSPEDIAQYLHWVQAIVEHFQGRVKYYEILNEPDLSFEMPSGMPVENYVHLVEVTTPVIRQADPEARVVVGAVPFTLLDGCREWMWELLSSDVMADVDGFSWHGMYGSTPAGDPLGSSGQRPDEMKNYWENYEAMVAQIKETAGASGFRGEYMSEEMVWRNSSSPGSPSEPTDFTDITGAKYYARAIIIHLGLDVAPGLSLPLNDVMPRAYAVVQALSTVMAGATPAEVPVRVRSDAENIRYYGFSLPNGDKMLAIWTDGPAVENDPGVYTTLTFIGASGQTATGIDVLNEHTQELVTGTDGYDLVIRNLLIMDYPIIIRLH